MQFQNSIDKNMQSYKYTTHEKTYKYSNIHPKLEITREYFIKALFDKFHGICIKSNPQFPKHKSIDFMTRFCWKNESDIDPVIPYNASGNYEIDQLKTDLTNYGFDAKNILTQLNIAQVLNDSMKKFGQVYDSINPTEQIQVQKQYDVLTYDRWTVDCSEQIFDKLERFYNGKFPNKLALYFCILYRYNILDADNQQLSVNIDLKKELTQKFNIDWEMFGSCFNRSFHNYGSIYYDLERYFGSVGNFFSNDYISGLYMANPPFDETIMKNMALKLIDCLDKTTMPLGFVIVIPVWDFNTMQKISHVCKTKYVNMGPYAVYDILLASKYYTKHYTFCKNNFPYFNFKKNTLMGATNTFIIILKNDAMQLDMQKMNYVLAKYNPIP